MYVVEYERLTAAATIHMYQVSLRPPLPPVLRVRNDDDIEMLVPLCLMLIFRSEDKR